MVLAGQVYTSYMLDSQDSQLSSENLLEVEFFDIPGKMSQSNSKSCSRKRAGRLSARPPSTYTNVPVT